MGHKLVVSLVTIMLGTHSIHTHFKGKTASANHVYSISLIIILYYPRVYEYTSRVLLCRYYETVSIMGHSY